LDHPSYLIPKGRIILSSEPVQASLPEHPAQVKVLHEQDLAAGDGSVYLRYALERKHLTSQ